MCVCYTGFIYLLDFAGFVRTDEYDVNTLRCVRVSQQGVQPCNKIVLPRLGTYKQTTFLQDYWQAEYFKITFMYVLGTFILCHVTMCALKKKYS